jgi:hypothetical protein
MHTCNSVCVMGHCGRTHKGEVGRSAVYTSNVQAYVQTQRVIKTKQKFFYKIFTQRFLQKKKKKQKYIYTHIYKNTR